jgi:hypothetical protein
MGSQLGLARHLWRLFSILPCPPFELKWADEVERRMAGRGLEKPSMERPISMVASIRLWKMLRRQTSSALRVLKNVSTMALSKPT